MRQKRRRRRSLVIHSRYRDRQHRNGRPCLPSADIIRRRRSSVIMRPPRKTMRATGIELGCGGGALRTSASCLPSRPAAFHYDSTQSWTTKIASLLVDNRTLRCGGGIDSGEERSCYRIYRRLLISWPNGITDGCDYIVVLSSNSI